MCNPHPLADWPPAQTVRRTDGRLRANPPALDLDGRLRACASIAGTVARSECDKLPTHRARVVATSNGRARFRRVRANDKLRSRMTSEILSYWGKRNSRAK